MSWWWRLGAVSVGAVVAVVAAAGPVAAQIRGNPAEAPVQWGPLSVAPEIRIAEIGYDSNVFSQTKASDPPGDFVTMASPAAEAWLRLPHAQLSGRSEINYVYYQNASSLRSWDSENSGRIDVLLGRLNPYVVGSFANLRHRQSVEIDAPIRRLEENAVAGVDVRLTGKTSFNVRTTRARSAFDDNAEYFDSLLARALNHTTTGEGVSVRYELTPFTMVALDLDRTRERFDYASDRDANAYLIGPSITLKPLAVISGRAWFGVRKRTFLDAGEAPPYRTFTALVDLQYTFREQTRFTVEYDRDLRYSFRIVQREYVLSGLSVAVVHRLADPWDVRASVGRDRLSYGEGALAAISVAPEVETVYRYRGEVGYRVGRTRLGVHVQYRTRVADVSPLREYQRVRIGSSLTYYFD